MARSFISVEFPSFAGIEVETSERGIRRVKFLSDEQINGSYQLRGKVYDDGSPVSFELLSVARLQLLEYFRGRRKSFSLPLDLKDATPFQTRVWNILRVIPYGTTMTYGEVAVRAGSPGASRAVGNACAKNPVPIIIPCHRVIRSDGGLGGFTGGSGIKESLLRHEKNPLFFG